MTYYTNITTNDGIYLDTSAYHKAIGNRHNLNMAGWHIIEFWKIDNAISNLHTNTSTHRRLEAISWCYEFISEFDWSVDSLIFTTFAFKNESDVTAFKLKFL